MKLLMSRSGSPYTVISEYMRPLQTMADVRGVDVDTRISQGRASIPERILYRLAPRLWFESANRRWRDSARTFRPDVTWIFKGADIYPDTLRAMRSQGIFLVNYNGDHPFEFFARGSGNRNVAEAIGLYDLYITYSERIERQLHERYPDLRTGVIPFGHNVDDDLFAAISQGDEIPRACFVGNPDKRRADAVRTLLEAGVPMDVFGHRWEDFLSPSANLRMSGQAVGPAMYQCFHRYRLQLNVMRPHNEGSHNMRTFEVPACGGIILTEDTPEQRAFFETGREAFVFTDDASMIAQAKRILAMDRADADAVRRQARERSASAGYTYADRARTALHLIAQARAITPERDRSTR